LVVSELRDLGSIVSAHTAICNTLPNPRIRFVALKPLAHTLLEMMKG
jgi:hypothetical protein